MTDSARLVAQTKPIFDKEVFALWEEACPACINVEHRRWNCEQCVQYIKKYHDPTYACEQCGAPGAEEFKKKFAPGMCGDGHKTKSYCVECMHIPSGWKCPTPGCVRDIQWRHQEKPSVNEKCRHCYQLDVLRTADAVEDGVAMPCGLLRMRFVSEYDEANLPLGTWRELGELGL